MAELQAKGYTEKEFLRLEDQKLHDIKFLKNKKFSRSFTNNS